MYNIKLHHLKHGCVREFTGEKHQCEQELKKWKYFYGKKFDECTVEWINKTKKNTRPIVYRPTGEVYKNPTEASKRTPHTFYTVLEHLKNNFDVPPPKGRLFHYLEE